MIRIAIALLLLLPAASLAKEFTGKVVGVADGDTIKVLHEGKEVKVRLNGIDCPEKGQAFGTKAKQATSELALGKEVTVIEHGTDRYGRTLGDVILPDGKNLNEELVRSGLAWWYRKYSKDKTLERLEAEAREAKQGLWADAMPVAPWDWRKQERATDNDFAEVKPNGVEIVALLPNPAGRDKGHEEIKIGNSTDRPMKLDGWKVRDYAHHEFRLFGDVRAGGKQAITVIESDFSLNNDGDLVELLDAGGVVRSRVSYVGDEIGPGEWKEFGGE